METTIFIIVPSGVHPLDLTGPAQVFYEAKTLGADFELTYAGIENVESVHSSAGIKFGGLRSWQDTSPKENDIIILPGAQMEQMEKYNRDTYGAFYDWLVLQYRNKVCLCSICTGAYFLGVAGLLNDSSYTTHWRYHDYFRKAFPYGKLETDHFFVSNGNLITSAGISSGIDLSLHLVEKRYDSALAAEVARECVLYLRRGPSDPQLSVFMDYRNHIDDRVHKVQQYISENLDTSLRIPELAEIAITSPRNLTRRFKKVTGITIGAYIDRLRVEYAYQLLKKGLVFSSVTRQCGLKSEEHLRNLLKKHRNQLPSDILS